jgi:hypothetical protein
MGFARIEIIDPATFTTDGDVIRGRAHLTRHKLDVILSWIEGQARERFGQ